MTNTNWEKWQIYTNGLASPQNYIDWAWLYLISASLSRRVWCPPDWRRCYPNMYITLVGRPGIGKGQVIRSVLEILRHYKITDIKPDDPNASTDEKKVLDAMHESTVSAAEKEESDKEPPLLIPIAADAVTYEALVQSMARCVRRINYRTFDEKLGRDRMAIYSYSGNCFCLEEIASLFRKNTESLVNFLIQAYDCGDNYEYVTKTQGKDRIRKLCLNFFGGTNPDFMQDTFDDKLLSQGYASRTFFIYAARNRKSMFFLPELTEEQKQAKADILKHVAKLSQLYGQCHIDKETIDYLETLIHEHDNKPQTRASQSTKLEAYYARWNIHMMKVAMAYHYGESTDRHVPLSAFQWTEQFLRKEERTMHLALVLEGNNPEAKAAKKIESYLSASGKKGFVELLREFYGDVNKQQLTAILQYMQDVGIVVAHNEMDETDERIIRYDIKRIK